MGVTFTPRLGLTVDDDVDPIDQFISNWNILDAAPGTILVNAGVTPSNSVLYDGALVMEKVTGKIWMAQKNALGGYDKVWVKYPWVSAYVTQYNSGLPSDRTYRLIPGAVYQPTQSINSAGSITSNGFMTIPETGFYKGFAEASFTTNFTGGRGLGVALTSSTNPLETKYQATGTAQDNPNCVLQVPFYGKLTKGDNLITQVWQQSGITAINVNSTLVIAADHITG